MKKSFLLLIFCAAFATACGTKSSVEGDLDTLFSELFPAGGPGAQVIITKGGEIVYDKGFGVADIETGAPITDSTMFNICSISKQFSAMALFILAEQGKLSLEDPVSKFFPQFKADFFNRITLAHLLSHTSGLPDCRPRTEKEWKKYREKNASIYDSVDDYKLYCEEEESCRYMETLDSLAFEPGTAYEYQNPTFQLILGIVEQVTGEKFDDWMRENIFLPSGMPGTVYFEPDRQIANMAHGYIKNKGEVWEEFDFGEDNFFGTKADGGIYTTALEFVNWDKALYGDVLISSEMRRQAHTGHIATDLPFTDYGYGWFIEHRPDCPLKIYHTGDNGGFYTYECRIPEKDIFYLIFANQFYWDRYDTADKVDKILKKNDWL